MSQYVETVVGGQYGSEAKGHVTQQLVQAAARDARIFLEDHPELELPETINIRVAGPNAGHTVYDEAGNKFALRQIPVGAVYPDVQLYIAPGSEIDLDVLFDEINTLEHSGHSLAGRLYISREATVIGPEHKTQEAELVGRIGSTGKGIGAARAARLLRQATTMGQQFFFSDDGQPFEFREPHEWYANDTYVHDKNSHLVIEGTQGFGLGLHAGHYPQVTSSDARAIDFQAMAGVDPTRCSVKSTNWIVARVFPIRVAGNSGPMKGETTWEALGLPEEKTTVTQKVRRVGAWDPELLAAAVQANGGHKAKVVITMLDQIIPELSGYVETHDEDGTVDTSGPLQLAMDWINEHASYEQIGAHVGAITYGPTDFLFTGAGVEDNTNGLPAGIDIEQIMGQIFGGQA